MKILKLTQQSCSKQIIRLDIQGYCEKSDKFDQLLLLIESGIKSIAQMNQIKKMLD